MQFADNPETAPEVFYLLICDLSRVLALISVFIIVLFHVGPALKEWDVIYKSELKIHFDKIFRFLDEECSILDKCSLTVCFINNFR